jgi:predicted TIM-barrel fold metal-dependent hydrolase
MAGKAIDILCYLFTPEAIKKMFIDTPEFAKILKWWNIKDGLDGWQPEEFIARMDKFGIDKICIPAVKMARYRKHSMIWDISEEEVAEIVRYNPDRFIGLAGVNPFSGSQGLRQMEKAVKEYGFKGVYMHTYGFGIPINHKLYYPYFAKCVELDIPFITQVGHSAEVMPSELAKPILLDEIAVDFPELRLVGAHTGWPWVEELLAIAWKHPNVYVAIDAHMPKYLDPSLINFIKGRGKEKVLYGTNGPLLFTHEITTKQIKELGFSEDVQDNLLFKNAQRLFNLK